MNRSFKVISFLALWLVNMSNAQSAPEAKGIAFWGVSDESNATKVDHSVWQDVLDKYLDSTHSDGVNRFDYEGVSDEDAKLLTAYVDSLEALDPRKLSKAEQEAYWINLYNAATVELIVKEEPEDSISEIRESFFSLNFGPWNIKLLNIQGQKVSLNDIEHGVLRPYWKEPRHHFAVNCASFGCPNLQKTAFTSSNTERLLQKGTMEFINHARGAQFKDGSLTLSSIFDWYGVDFGDSQQAVFDYVQKHRLLDKKLPKESANDIDYEYDWALNKP